MIELFLFKAIIFIAALVMLVIMPEILVMLGILLSPFIVGFLISEDSSIKNISNYTCTPAQLEQVVAETNACKDAGGDGAKCFTQAKFSICTKNSEGYTPKLVGDVTSTEPEQGPIIDEEIEAILRN